MEKLKEIFGPAIMLVGYGGALYLLFSVLDILGEIHKERKGEKDGQ